MYKEWGWERKSSSISERNSISLFIVIVMHRQIDGSSIWREPHIIDHRLVQYQIITKTKQNNDQHYKHKTVHYRHLQSQKTKTKKRSNNNWYFVDEVNHKNTKYNRNDSLSIFLSLKLIWIMKNDRLTSVRIFPLLNSIATTMHIRFSPFHFFFNYDFLCHCVPIDRSIVFDYICFHKESKLLWALCSVPHMRTLTYVHRIYDLFSLLEIEHRYFFLLWVRHARESVGP